VFRGGDNVHNACDDHSRPVESTWSGVKDQHLHAAIVFHMCEHGLSRLLAVVKLFRISAPSVRR
jgi:hypothetical protein